MFYLYVLYSPKVKRYYVGVTANLADRLRRHNGGRNPSTKSGTPWVVVYREQYLTRAAAVGREQKIKSYHGGRAFREMLGSHPTPGGEVA